MEKEFMDHPGSILYIPHGGGPLPLLGDEGHRDLVNFLKQVPSILEKPSAILIISAHWEDEIVTITSGSLPSLFYDYYGFPDEGYEIEYPAPGDPRLASKIYALLQDSGIEVRLDDQRGL